jgi:hypothetical protein
VLSLSSKSKLKRLVDESSRNPIKGRLVELLGVKRVLAEEIKDVMQLASTKSGTQFKSSQLLNRATKLRMLDWTAVLTVTGDPLIQRHR